MTIRVLLVDDQTLVRQGICSLLQLTDNIKVVGQLDNGNQVLAGITQYQPDLLLLDIRMPGMSGLEVLHLLQEKNINLPTLILTTFDEHELVLKCLRLGAKGYLKKDTDLETLVMAIIQVAKGQTWVQPITPLPLNKQNPESKALKVIQHEPLTNGETQVLRLVAAGYSNQEIAHALHKSPGTVRNTVSVILAKLQARDRTRAVLKAMEHKLI